MTERIIIDVTKKELDFIREAINHKFSGMLSYFDACEENSKPIPTTTQLNKMIGDEFDKELAKVKKPHWTQTPAGKKIMAKRKRRGSK